MEELVKVKNPKEIRQTILKMAYNAQSVHIGCSFSLVEIVHTLYSKFVNHQKLINQTFDRDYVCLSKGHGVMAVYSCLNDFKLVSDDEINNYFKDGSNLTGLSDAHVKGVEVSGGSLGLGVTVSLGIALASQLNNSESKIFCIVGDGELNEGSAWESIMIAAHHKLKNFFVIVDANSFQAMGKCHSVLNMESFYEKFKAFNFEVRECDGHSLFDLEKNINDLITSTVDKPKALIARTIKGKGVSFMENNNEWHYTRLTTETFNLAMAEVGL